MSGIVHGIYNNCAPLLTVWERVSNYISLVPTQEVGSDMWQHARRSFVIDTILPVVSMVQLPQKLKNELL